MMFRDLILQIENIFRVLDQLDFLTQAPVMLRFYASPSLSEYYTSYYPPLEYYDDIQSLPSADDPDREPIEPEFRISENDLGKILVASLLK